MRRAEISQELLGARAMAPTSRHLSAVLALLLTLCGSGDAFSSSNNIQSASRSVRSVRRGSRLTKTPNFPQLRPRLQSDADKHAAGYSSVTAGFRSVSMATWSGQQSTRFAARRSGSVDNSFLQDVVNIHGVRFERWTNAKAETDSSEQSVEGSVERKRLLLYLPGIEGLGTSVEPQLSALSERFDVYRVILGANDRSTFYTLSRAVSDFVDAAGRQTGTKTVVVGESFGGMLSLRLGQLRPERVQCVFAINPATSFGRTAWRSLGPLLSFAPKDQYKAATIAVFAATIPDTSQMMSVIDDFFSLNNGLDLAERPKALANRLGGIWSMVLEVSDNLPPATLRWRIQNWLAVGQGRVEKDLRKMKVPVTVIAGSADRLLPSPEEAKRLKNIIPGCRMMILEGHGHAPLFDGRVDLSEIIASDPAMADVKLPQKPDKKAGDGATGADGGEGSRDLPATMFAKDWVEDFEEPSEKVVAEGRKSIDFLFKSVSPVLFSTKEDGTAVAGLSAVPTPDRSRPILFVGNHQLLALDLGVIVERLYSERGILARGLTHPMVFMGQSTPRALDGAAAGVVRQSEEDDMHKAAAAAAAAVTPNTASSKSAAGKEGTGAGDGVTEAEGDANGMMTFFTKFGAVPVTPRNMYRLLERGDNVLLFPGGVREAYHKKGDDYKLFWPDKGEFVRLAAATKSGAVIIPFSAVGIADSLEMVLDGDGLLDIPYIGERLRKSSAGVPTARGGDAQEQFVPPAVIPKLPSRLYVRFGQPISLEGVNKGDKDSCQRIYEDVKSEVELGIESLLKAREADPYLDPAKRLVYERVRGESAPTLEPAVLDAAVARTRLVMDGKRRRRLMREESEAKTGSLH